MALIKFTRNYQDHSTDAGYQFEFFCDRCGTGYKTKFEGSLSSTASSALDAAAGIFGGIFGNAADIGHRVHSAGWEKGRDAAMERAIAETKQFFKQCRRCSKWVGDECWNKERGLCLDCAPDLESEASHIQTQAAIDDMNTKARTVDYVSADKFKQTVSGSCPNCGAALTGGKFCPECGKPVVQKKFCTECGKEVQAGVKFCPECGAKQG
ncbi:MAG: zinc ribbon domain-containing protein [Anaerolineae bacterium]